VTTQVARFYPSFLKVPLAGLSTFFTEVGGISIFICKTVKTLLTTQGNSRAVFQQIQHVSYRSLPTVIFAGFFVGAILVIQFNSMLMEYDAQSLLGGINSSAVIREVGPLIISFLLAGKIGAYTAAELGTMRVTEQIDAIECLGTNPMQFLIAPRFIAIVFSSVLLLIIGVIVSVCGGMLVADLILGVNYLKFMQSIPDFTTSWTIFAGVFRSLVYGIIVAGVSTYKGFTARGGAKGVGKAVTEAAVYTNFLIVLANYLCSNILDAAHTLFLSAQSFISGGIL